MTTVRYPSAREIAWATVLSTDGRSAPERAARATSSSPRSGSIDGSVTPIPIGRCPESLSIGCAGGSAGGGVERLVDERVGGRVLGARHRAQRPAREAAKGGHRLLVERAHVGVLDLVGAADLARHQL